MVCECNHFYFSAFDIDASFHHVDNDNDGFISMEELIAFYRTFDDDGELSSRFKHGVIWLLT